MLWQRICTKSKKTRVFSNSVFLQRKPGFSLRKPRFSLSVEKTQVFLRRKPGFSLTIEKTRGFSRKPRFSLHGEKTRVFSLSTTWNFQISLNQCNGFVNLTKPRRERFKINCPRGEKTRVFSPRRENLGFLEKTRVFFPRRENPRFLQRKPRFSLHGEKTRVFLRKPGFSLKKNLSCLEKTRVFSREILDQRENPGFLSFCANMLPQMLRLLKFLKLIC